MRLAVVLSTIFALLVTGWPVLATAASVPDAGSLVFPSTSAQLQKPHRLTWFAEGRWWAVLRKSSGAGSGWRVWRRSAEGTWDFGPEVLSTSGSDRFDVFRNPDDGRVFALHLNTTQSRLLRLVYNPASDMFLLNASANVPPAPDGEIGTLTVDTVGRVWIAMHPNGQFAYTVRDASTLGQIVPLTVLANRVQPQSLVAGRFVDNQGPAVGFIYAGAESPYLGNFVVHRDAHPVGNFSTEVFADRVDGHTTFAAEGADVVAVWKDRRDRVGEPIILVSRRLANGYWDASVPVFLGKSTSSSGNHTRPRVVLDAQNRRVHVAAAEVTSTAEEVHERVAAVDTLSFGPQRTIFRSGETASGHVFQDVHAGQQVVTSASGLLWLARGREVTNGTLGSWSVWENHVGLGAGSSPTPSPTATPTPSPTATPTPSPTATPTPSPTATPTPSPTATPTPAPAPMHIGGMVGTTSTQGKSWTARVTVTVHSGEHAALRGAVVVGTWSTGDGASCTTGGRGQQEPTCNVQSSKLATTTASATFTVTDVVLAGYVYVPQQNHHPGTSIVVVR